MNEKKRNILKAHGKRCYTVNGKGLYIYDEYTKDGVYHRELINVETWTIKEILEWLGY